MISLGEGSTPLVRSYRLEHELGCGELYFKLEGCNPTGSFKDRGMVLAVAKALEEGSQAILCASTGNTSASAAAYAARCGIQAIVVVPKGNVAMGKFAQALIYRARAIAIEGNFDTALQLARALCERHPMTLVNSLNPHRLEGQKTAAFEICDDLGDAPDLLCLPVGNAGNITAYWRGFCEYARSGKITRTPRMMGFEAEGAAPIALGHVVDQPRTVASAIRIGNPASWRSAEVARDESGGVIDTVSDDEILQAHADLATQEGLFAEPASAASLAGLAKLVGQGLDLTGKRVVCVLTGNGLKDPDTAVQRAQPMQEVRADLAALEAALGLE